MLSLNVDTQMIRFIVQDQPVEGEKNDGQPPSHRFSAVIEKIERLYMVLSCFLSRGTCFTYNLNSDFDIFYFIRDDNMIEMSPNILIVFFVIINPG